MAVHKQHIPFVSLESEVGRNFDIRPLRRQINADTLQEGLHRHDFQELLWVRHGSGRHRIDDDILEIQPRTFYLITQGQIHYFIEGIDLEGYVLRFSDDFLADDIAIASWNYRVTLFSHFSLHQMLSPTADAQVTLQTIMDDMWQEIQGDQFGRQHILRHHLSILMILLERARRQQPHTTNADTEHLVTFQAFITLLEQGFREEHAVSYYAETLYITPRQLSDIVKRCTGKTAKTLILERIMLEAKRHLQHSNASIKEIAYALGFKDSSYFSKVFKQATGVSPNQYQVAL
ncbi:MAG: helix-turn-helix transcriptional regulator [Phototrophicaceae bacterium]